VSRRLMTLLAVLALAIGTLAPATAAGAQVTDTADTPTVEKSQSGSYIAVMEADPLLADFDQDQLASKQAQKKAKGLKKDQDKALEDAGPNCPLRRAAVI
jgi:hypothetical protein